MTFIQPRVLSTTIGIPQTSFNNAIPDGNLGSIKAPAAGSDPAGMYVSATNVTVKGPGTYIIMAAMTIVGTANYHYRLQIQVNGVTVRDSGDRSNSLTAQAVSFDVYIQYTGLLNDGDVIRVAGGMSTGGGPEIGGTLVVARQTLR